MKLIYTFPTPHASYFSCYHVLIQTLGMQVTSLFTEIHTFFFFLIYIFPLLYVYLLTKTTLITFLFFSCFQMTQQNHTTCPPSEIYPDAIKSLFNLVVELGPYKALTLFRKS